MSARVLVVDDSAFVRKVVREVLGRAGFDVVDYARDGLEALEKIERLRPDVVTLDLMMPHLDGLGVLDALAELDQAPAVVVVSTLGVDTAQGVVALERGAVALVEKSTTLASRQLYEMGDSLVEQVRIAALSRPFVSAATPAPQTPTPPPRPAVFARRSMVELVVLGASTGGPYALTRIITELPANLPVPVVVALHIPVGYTHSLAERLDGQSQVSVFEASDGDVLQPGTVAIARAGMHLRVVRSGDRLRASLGLHPVGAPHRPSVDVLFESAATVCGRHALGVMLTGMGHDGLEGCRALHASGAAILAQDEATSVVWGMPGAVCEAGLATRQVALPDIADAIVARM